MTTSLITHLRQPLSPPERSMLLFLSADALMAVTLLGAFAYLRLRVPVWPDAFHFGSGLMAAAMTMFLLSGSFTVFLAVRAAQGQGADAHTATRWIGITVAVWCCFLLLESLEWARLLVIDGVTLRTNPWNVPLFGATYYILTGFHALHVLGGIVYLSFVAIRGRDVRASQWLVHFVNALWLPLYIGLYLASTDLQGL